MRCPLWLYHRVDCKGRIPRWVWWLWPHSHWCPEMDGLLIIDNFTDCFCDECEPFAGEMRQDEMTDFGDEE